MLDFYQMILRITAIGLAALTLMSCGERDNKADTHQTGGGIPLVKVSAAGLEFWMAEHEVTQAEFQAVMDFNPSIELAANLPVDRMTRGEAIAFCAERTKLDRATGVLPQGKIYRLPNLSEWLIAAMPGGELPSGATQDEAAWHQKNSGGVVHEVGSKKANVHGIHDLFGNVAEWTESDEDGASKLREIFRSRIGDLEKELRNESASMAQAREQMLSLVTQSDSDDGLRFNQSKWPTSKFGEPKEPKIEIDEYQSSVEALRERIRMLDSKNFNELAKLAPPTSHPDLITAAAPHPDTNDDEPLLDKRKRLLEEGLGEQHPLIKEIDATIQMLDKMCVEAAKRARLELHKMEQALAKVKERQKENEAAREAEVRLGNQYRATRDEYQQRKERVEEIEVLIQRAGLILSDGHAEQTSSLALGGSLSDSPAELWLPALVSPNDQRMNAVGFRFVMVEE